MGLLLAVAILTSFYLTPVAMQLAWRYGAVSRPDGYRKRHRRPTPAWGGVAVNASILVGLGLSCVLVPHPDSDRPFFAALASSIVALAVLGCYDDLFDMRAGAKLAGQFLAVLPLIAVGAYVERFTLFGLPIELGWFGIPWTAAWMVLGINALNLIDGMDGLASTIGITIAVAVGAIAAVNGSTDVVIIAVVLAGALGGFLPHNLPPARVYLGDCGSMVVGLVLATLATRVAPQPGLPSLAAMGALLFVPLYDTLLAIVRRGLSGKGIMAADHGHVHHRLLERGLGVWGALGVLAGISVAVGGAGCCAVLAGHELMAGVALAIVPLLCAQLELFGHSEWAAVRERLGLPRFSGTASRYKYSSKGLSGRELAQDASAVRNQLDGLSQSPASRPLGINVRLAGAPSAGSTAAGKEYVELLR
ncbi:MAG: MraY family glycosyltransferase [Thermoguttaceae bacterium]